MLVVCPDCEVRHIVTRQSRNLELTCPCGKTLTVLPWLSYRQITSGKKTIKCPLCSQRYDSKQFRHNTEIACSCGNLFMVLHSRNSKKGRGRRGNDRESGLRELELQGLIDTSRLIHSSIQDLDHLLLLIIRITSDMIDVEGSTIVLCDREKDELVFHAVTGKNTDKLNRFRLKAGEGIVGGCIQHRESVLINDAQKDIRFANRVDRISGFSTRSILCVPLTIEEECIGALEMVNKENEDGFCKHDLLLAEAVASQIAVAIRNVHLAEEALKAERLAAIGQAVTGIAHCIKNMLSGIQGGVYLVGITLQKLTGGQPDRGFEMLKRNQERMMGLVKDMLTFSKEHEPEYVKTDLNELVESVVDMVRTAADERKVNLAFDPDRSLDKIFMEPTSIYRCVLNLVSNAIDACNDEGSRVTVRTCKGSRDSAVIEVEDNGSGIPAEVVDQIFQPFFSSKGSKGTGLGLAVTRKIIQEHGGSLTVDSTPGQGSTFTIRLPYRPPSGS